MSIFENVTSSVGRGVEKGETLLKDSADFAADRASDIWDGMKVGARNAAGVASELPEFLDFNSDPLFNAQFNVRGSAQFGFGDGTVRTISDGSSNTVLIGEQRDTANGERGRDRDEHCHGRDDYEHGRDDSGWDRDGDQGWNGRDGRGRDGRRDRDWDNSGDGRWNDDRNCDGRHGEVISPIEMLQQMQDISQQLQQLTALLAQSGFGGGSGDSPARGSDSRGGFGFEGSIQGQMQPFQLVGQIAELAKQLAPIAAKMAPALIALV